MNDFCLTTDERVLQGYKQGRADVLKEVCDFIEKQRISSLQSPPKLVMSKGDTNSKWKCQVCLKELDNRFEIERQVCHKCWIELNKEQKKE